MNMKSTRKRISWVLLLIMVLSSFSVVMADKAYIVETYTIGGSKTAIYEGNEFNISINLSKLKDIGGDAAHTLVNTSTAFVIATGGTSKKIGSIGADPSESITLALRYTGSGQTFSFNIINDASGAVVTSDSILIKEAVESSSTSTTPPETTKYVPDLSLKGSDLIGTFSAGKQNEVTLTLNNTSSYQAKNIAVSLEKAEDTMPIQLEGAILKGNIAAIDPKKSGDLKFKFTIGAAVAPKTYALQLKLSYENAWGDSFGKPQPIVIPVYIKVENNATEPMVYLVDTLLEGGQLDDQAAKNLTLSFKNTGTLKASKITVQLTGFKADGVRLYQDTDFRLLGAMATGMTGKANFNIIASKNAKGPLELEALVKYYDDMGVLYEKKYPVYLELSDSMGSGSDTKGISVTFDKATYTLDSKTAKTIAVTVKNNSSVAKSNLKLTMSSDATLKYLTPYVQLVETLAPGESKVLSFKALLGGQATPNTYPIYATLVAQGGSEGDQQVGVAGVYIADEDQGGSKPKIIIESYEYGGDAVMAGSEFELLVRFSNTSDVMGIKNAKVVMTADEGVFIPVDSANSFFIQKIGAGETVEQVLKLKAKADAKVQMYGIAFKIDYEDQNGKSYDEMKNPYTAEERISLNVKQEVRLEVSDIILPFEAYVGTPVPVEVEFFNMGKSPMYNLMVKLEGNFQAQNSNYFVGNFDAGRSDYYSGQLIPEVAGEIQGQLRFVFEDENGVKQEKSFPVSLMVMEGGGFPDGEVMPPIDPDMGGEVYPPEEGGFKLPLWAWAAIVVVPLAIGGIVVLRIRKQKRLKALSAVADEE